MSLQPSQLFIKAQQKLREAGLTLRYGHDRPAPAEPDWEAIEADRQERLARADRIGQEAHQEFMEPYRRFEREKHGSSPRTLAGEAGQLRLDMSFDEDQRDLFAGVNG